MSSLKEIHDKMMLFPNDLKMCIMKKVLCNIDMRIKFGLIKKIVIPNNLKAELDKIQKPFKITENNYGIKLNKYYIIYRKIKPSKMFDYLYISEYVYETRYHIVYAKIPIINSFPVTTKNCKNEEYRKIAPFYEDY